MGQHSEHDGSESDDGRDRNEPLQHGPHRVEDRDLLDRERHRRQLGDSLVAHDVDHLRTGDLHRATSTDDASVDVGDDVGEELAGFWIADVRGQLEGQLVRGLADRFSGGVGDDSGQLATKRGVGEDLAGDGTAARRVERDALHPPAPGCQGEQDGGDKEQQPGESAAHRAKSGKDRPTHRIGDAAAGVRWGRE